MAPSMLNETVPPMDPAPLPNPPIPASYENPAFVNQSSPPAWELPLRLVPPTGPVDSILIGLLQRQRGLALSGSSRESVTGSYSPSLKALLNPEQSNSVHPVTSVISSLLQRTALRGLPEKAAALFVVYHLSQWQILPSEETYNNLPEWHVPRASQLLTPHPIWVDQVSIKYSYFKYFFMSNTAPKINFYFTLLSSATDNLGKAPRHRNQ